MPDAKQYKWEKLIGRTVLPPDLTPVDESIRGKCVLVTGAGGSIGSALVHAVAGRGARRIVLLDASEQNLYRVDAELDAPHVSVLVNVCDRGALKDVFSCHRPQIVFHGAAFKHVPLMEQHPFASVENNSLGTFRVVQAAAEHGAERFILISTDKAADPIGIMGASKRIAELIVLAMPACSMRISAVRLGNVAGSEGSVFPLFLKQIAAGELVTVTHPEVSRYFITLEETVNLLLLAATRRVSGEVLVPDLGAPFRIADLARKLITEHGEEGVNRSQIVFTRLRPGDKLRETLVSSTESLVEGSPGPLYPVHSPCPPWSDIKRAIEELGECIVSRDLGRLLTGVHLLVPEYRTSGKLNPAKDAIQMPSAELAPERNA